MLEINIQENSQDKLQILCVFAVFLFLMYKLCMGLGEIGVKTIDLLDDVKCLTNYIEIAPNHFFLEERCMVSKYQKGLPDNFSFWGN